MKGNKIRFSPRETKISFVYERTWGSGVFFLKKGNILVFYLGDKNRDRSSYNRNHCIPVNCLGLPVGDSILIARKSINYKN